MNVHFHTSFGTMLFNIARTGELIIARILLSHHFLQPPSTTSIVPFTCLQPSCSITSGGNTLDAKARLKMALNSVSSPPMPILLKSQSGLMIDCLTTLPLDLPLRWMEDPSPFSKMTVVFGMLMPTCDKETKCNNYNSKDQIQFVTWIVSDCLHYCNMNQPRCGSHWLFIQLVAKIFIHN